MNSVDVTVRSRFHHYRPRAKLRNRLWNLAFEEFKVLVLANCSYCKQAPHMLVKTQNHECLMNGIDRQNSDIGYVLNNCVTACRFCNCAKGDATLEEFKTWLNRIKTCPN